MQLSKAAKELNNVGAQKSKSSARLGSGYKLNKASDDVAGLGISEQMRSQIRGLMQASTNSQDGISMIQVADGAMHEIQSILDRTYELSIQAANDTYTHQEKQQIQEEVEGLLDELNSIYQNTEFNTKKVLQGNDSKTITKIETIVEKYYEEETIWETKGELPDFITSTGFQTGYLDSTIKMEEIMYERLNDRIVKTNPDGTEVEVDRFTSSSGFTYEKGSPYKVTSAGSGTLKLQGDDGLTYTIYRSYNKYMETQTHASSFVDFTKVTKDNINELINTGFQTTCCSCEQRYSIKFVDDKVSSVQKDGKHYIYNINIKDVETSDELLTRIMDALAISSGSTSVYTRTDSNGVDWEVTVPQNHFTGMALEKDTSGNNTGRLLIYDFPSSAATRRPNPSAEQGILAEGFYESTTILVEKELIKEVETTVTLENEDYILQIGTNKDQTLTLKMPDTSLKALKIDPKLKVTDLDSASKAIETFKYAKSYISKERSRMGAYQNRLEHTISALNNTAENTVEAESRIRDADLSQEIVKQARSNILEQAIQSIMAQATQQEEQILSILNA
ncbi:MAG: flagellin [bacterium]|nr:flagellin [bacterium]